ncbi:LOW QUALITY PROTEIN: hypothetical protein HID58_057901 [Brassica napus]|uniref:Uncharacterized protein n=1 Tax=Brassica napus TaxID=3708 RepID=A0ABQ7ZNG6_BRANA|nr:LOW QUALITY PROTEIN: hypothetical protein HID58_057901 [Brassica napus]
MKRRSGVDENGSKFTKSSCCMCHTIKTLFYELAASSAIHELDQGPTRSRHGTTLLQSLRGRYVGSAKGIIDLLSRGWLAQADA